MNRSIAIVSAFLLLLSGPIASAGSQLFRWEGGESLDYFGASVASVGDLDRDGYRDILVGAPGSIFDSGHAQGYVRVYSGKDGSKLREWTGGVGFGRVVAGPGDVNDDGVVDVFVGDVGEVWVYSGKDGALMWHFAIDYGGSYGFSIDGIGDIDHDGHADLIVGDPFADRNGKTDNGHVMVLSGKTGAQLYTYSGSSSGDYLGWAVCGAGDVTQDGTPDFLMSAPHADVSGTNDGLVQLRSGATGNLIATWSGDPGAEFGASLASKVDVNLHGAPDIVIGSPGPSSGSSIEGYVYVYAGETKNLIYFFRGVHDGDHFGASVALGDIDHDQLPDVIVGSPDEVDFPYAHGRVRVYGAYGNLIRTYSGGYFTNDHFGAHVACLGDINKDRYDDLVIADDWYDGAAGSGTGAVYVHSGQPYDAAWQNYGSGWPGTNGVPSLTLSDDPVLCTTIKIEIGNSRGFQTLGALLIGMDDAQIDSHMGGTVLVAPPWLIQTMAIPQPGLNLPVQIVCDSALTGLTLYLQMLEVDSGATWDTSFSRGLKLALGM